MNAQPIVPLWPGAGPLPLDDLESDAGHLVEMLNIASYGLEDFNADEPVSRAALARHSAVLWVTRDLADRLRDQLGQLASHPQLRRAMQDVVQDPAQAKGEQS